MIDALLVQLPVPRLNYGVHTGNIPLGAACLKQAARRVRKARVELLPESTVAYLGDAALLDMLFERKPDIVGFTVYCWNLERSLYFAKKLKELTALRIVFGGPEITPDNPAIISDAVDFYVYGEGEALFIKLLEDPTTWEARSGQEPAGVLFRESPSPYLSNLLEPEVENVMLLETQRGCPYRCGYCYYNKSHKGLSFADERHLLQGVQWALDRRVKELYLLDPSLNAHPGLRELLTKISRINHNRHLDIISEIRAESIDAELADLFAAAGFSWFEIGLQSTNPRALKIMRRPTRLKQFAEGAQLLKQRGIVPAIDLIVGLPGDDLQGASRSIEFVAAHQLADDVQVFPLLVLPGTDFRLNSDALGLRYNRKPPYTLIQSDTFSAEDLLLAFDHAEVRFDVVLYPMPDLDVSWRLGAEKSQAHPEDVAVKIADKPFITKLQLHSERPLSELAASAKRLTQPYQVFIHPALSSVAYIQSAVAVLTGTNPFTPFEMIFIEPSRMPRSLSILSAAKLQRPHFLDQDLRYLFPAAGNRAVLFTLVSQDAKIRFNRDMERQVFWWQQKRLPEMTDLSRLSAFDGVLVDVASEDVEIKAWQDRFAEQAEDLPFISFADVRLQRRWLMLTMPDDYAPKALTWV
ncbi:MAG: B12-binding domain-containing radical SAM protein [Desulfobacterales bacterium]|nr:B12-binding domain-containing radical SAM protein [Desulfobacterales bacterium]